MLKIILPYGDSFQYSKWAIDEIHIDFIYKLLSIFFQYIWIFMCNFLLKSKLQFSWICNEKSTVFQNKTMGCVQHGNVLKKTEQKKYKIIYQHWIRLNQILLLCFLKEFLEKALGNSGLINSFHSYEKSWLQFWSQGLL